MIIHLFVHMGQQDDETHRRMQVARESREIEYLANPGVWMAPALTFSRDSRRIGDEKPVPFVRDMITQGMAHAKSPDTILFLTNADIGFAPEITLALSEYARENAVHMRRRDLPRVDHPLSAEEIATGTEYPGGDAFAFTAAWWKKNGKIFPDMVLGRYGWDSAMRNMIRRAKGVELKNQIWHESHAGDWNTPGYEIEANAGNRHNRALLLAWIEKFGGSPEDHLHPTLKYL